MEEIELKPCPFCGATAEGEPLMNRVGIYQSELTKCFHVSCYKCGTTSNWYNTEKQAINAWNRRADNEKD